VAWVVKNGKVEAIVIQYPILYTIVIKYCNTATCKYCKKAIVIIVVICKNCLKFVSLCKRN